MVEARGALSHIRRVPDVPAIAGLPPALIADLRSDHAGETGAVLIYRGILAVARDPAVRAFAARHAATEQTHLDLLNAILPAGKRSWLLPIWRVAGFLTGALPALFGPAAVFATIDAVETFVDHHYQAQIDALACMPAFDDLRALLITCQADEVHHRDEARASGTRRPGIAARLWMTLVGAGSAAAVKAARVL
jgi:ubiquinone biosynthesis monooxygenase Coq7